MENQRLKNIISFLSHCFSQQSFLSILSFCLSLFTLYITYDLTVRSKEPYIHFTPSITTDERHSEQMIVKINVGNYGEGTGIIDSFLIKVNQKEYQHNTKPLWNTILKDNGMPEYCQIGRAWLPRDTPIRPGEETYFIKIIFSILDKQSYYSCIQPLIKLLKNGEITTDVQYHSIYGKHYRKVQQIQFDFSELSQQIFGE